MSEKKVMSPSTDAPADEILSARHGIEQETALLNEVVRYARQAVSGALEPKEAQVHLGAGRLIHGVVRQNITNRLSRGRLIMQEAKLINAA